MRRLRLEERIDIPLNSEISLRVYADSRPHVLQTANLQKGVIIIFNGMELVEEGLGIGVPVCRYGDGTHFSMSAETFIDDTGVYPTMVKRYDVNAVAAKRFREMPISRRRYFARFLSLLEKVYRALRRYRVSVDLLLDLLSLLGMRNEYLKSRSRGQIAVTYRLNARSLHVSADLRGLVADELESVVFANEQSGRLFNEYRDSMGVTLQGEEIEPWRVTPAEWASLHCRKFRLGFKLERPNGWRIARGREVVKDRISWSGLNLVHNGTPKTLEYRVQFMRDANSD